MKITEIDSFRKTVLKVVPSSDKEDVSLLVKKIKSLKERPFYSVFILMPDVLFFKYSKEFKNCGIKFKQAEIKYNIAKLEV